MQSKGNFERRGDLLLTIDDNAGRAIADRLNGTIDFVSNNRWKAPEGGLVRLELLNATEIDPKTLARFEESCTR
jgi:hypothetical protein